MRSSHEASPCSAQAVSEPTAALSAAVATAATVAVATTASVAAVATTSIAATTPHHSTEWVRPAGQARSARSAQ